MSAECVTIKTNLGRSRCRTLPQMFAGMISTPEDFVLSAANQATAALAKAALQAALKNGLASRIYKWPDLNTFEDKSTEAQYEQTPLSDMLAFPGKYAWMLGISHSLCLHKAMFTHSGPNQRVLFYDIEGNLFGNELSNGDMRGFKASLLNVEKLKIGDGGVATKTPVYVVLKDHNEIDESGLQLDAPFFDELFPLTDVDITLVTDSPGAAVTLTTFYIKVAASCDGTPVSGLVQADFDMGTLGVPTTGAAETSSGSGIYKFIKSTNFADGTINLVAASALSISAYESTGGLAINIP